MDKYDRLLCRKIKAEYKWPVWIPAREIHDVYSGKLIYGQWKFRLITEKLFSNITKALRIKSIFDWMVR